MKLATLATGTPDGALVAVSDDLARFMPTGFATLQAALERWDAFTAAADTLADTLADVGGERLRPEALTALLPRAWQWLDASAFASHGRLMQTAYKLQPTTMTRPVMYQGMSHRFLGPRDLVPFTDEALGIDFEAEFAVVTTAVPMGIDAADALDRIALVTLVNDWSLRVLGAEEMRTGFGWVQAKPACSMAAVGIRPADLGDVWRDGRVCLPLTVEWNGAVFGSPSGDAMAYGFHELIAHAARTRELPAGTVIGSGTVSNDDAAAVGSCCISERQAIEIIADGAPRTPFLRDGDEVAVYVPGAEGAPPPFGELRQRVAVTAR